MPKTSEYHDSDLVKAIASVASAFKVGTPFVKNFDAGSADRSVYANIVIDPDSLFSEKAIVGVVSGGSFDTRIVLAKLEQVFTREQIKQFAANDLVVIEFNCEVDQRLLAGQLAGALNKTVSTAPVKLFKLKREEWKKKLDGLQRLQVVGRVGHTPEVVPHNEKHDSDGQKPSKNRRPSGSIDDLARSEFSLTDLKVPSTNAAYGTRSDAATVVATEPVAKSIEAIRLARLDFIEAIQIELLARNGINGSDLTLLAKEVSGLMKASGLVVRPVSVSHADKFYRLHVERNTTWLENVDGQDREQLRTLPELVVYSLEDINDLRITNSVASGNIGLEPIDQVSQKTFSEFIDYFDKVHEHVEKRELIKQFQRWLDHYPDELRGFNKNVEAKRDFARKINERAKILGCRFRCPAKDCDQPSGLSVSLTGTSVSGLFVFKHQVNGKAVSHERKSILPKLQLVCCD